MKLFVTTFFCCGLILALGCTKPAANVSEDPETEANTSAGGETASKPSTETEPSAETTEGDDPIADSETLPANDTEATAPNEETAAAEPKTRKFDFNYDVAVSDLAPGTKARIWVPIATSGPFQTIELKQIEAPAEYEETTDSKYGNKFIYFEGTANDDGEIPISIDYTIERSEVLPTNAVAVDDSAQQLFLASNDLVPVDGSLTKRVFGDKQLSGGSMEKARQMYEAVESRMQYGKSIDKGWGRGDANFACDEKVGNCTDFHSLFIALSRDQQMPAKFEIGFPIPSDSTEGEVGGYHCWAYFSNGEKWLPVDISEADKHPEMKEYYFTRLTPDRVTFTQGRDLQLQPSPAAEKVNFAVYPYVEVDGKPHPNIRKAFRFRDIQ